MAEAFVIRAIAGAVLVWGIIFILSATGVVEALTAHPLLRQGNDNLGAGLLQLLFAAFFFFGEESFVAKFRLGRERMDWWAPLPLFVGLNIVAASWFIHSLATAVRG